MRRTLAVTTGAVIAVLCLTPSAIAQVTEFSVPTPDSQPSAITAGPDGGLWFTESAGNKIGRVTTSGAVTEFPIPTPNSQPAAITAGPDGALWFVEAAAGKIGRITTAGNITEFPIPAPISFAPSDITAGPDGALWFIDVNQIGRITTGGSVTEFPLPEAWMVAKGITAGPDGALWFTAGDASIGRITTSGNITMFETPTVRDPDRITAGPDGALWFTEAGKIGRITTAGDLTEFPIPTPNTFSVDITAGPDGALWFTQYAITFPDVYGKIGRITTAGAIGEFHLATDGEVADSIAAGPDRALWFTVPSRNLIGRLPAAAPPPEDRVTGVLFTAPPCVSPCNQSPRYVFDVWSDPDGQDAGGTVNYDTGERGNRTSQDGTVTCLFTDGNRATVGVNFAAAFPQGTGPPRAALIFLEDRGLAGGDRFAVQDLPAGTAPATCPESPPSGITLVPGFGFRPDDPGVTISDVEEPSNQPPRCDGVVAAPRTILHPNRRFVTVTLSGASDPDGDALSFHIDGVTQDEPVWGWFVDWTSPDAQLTAAGASSDKVMVRAERRLFGDGRVYQIAFTVSDPDGESCSGETTVSVRRWWWRPAVDSAPPSYDSFAQRRR